MRQGPGRDQLLSDEQLASFDRVAVAAFVASDDAGAMTATAINISCGVLAG